MNFIIVEDHRGLSMSEKLFSDRSPEIYTRVEQFYDFVSQIKCYKNYNSRNMEDKN